LFPQGTSTTADKVVHFHAPLLQSAVSAGTHVQPIAVFYHHENGGRHAAADFVGDMSFTQSLWRIVCAPDLRVTVTYLPAMDAAGQDRRTLASVAQQAVNEALARHLLFS
jgi:1-acyl-sn-glycerol-3-phosphate acyltransferase